MADDSLSNPAGYTIHLTAEEYQKHRRLLYIGSVMSQLLKDGYFYRGSRQRLSYSEALREIGQFLECGQEYSSLWDDLAVALYQVEGY